MKSYFLIFLLLTSIFSTCVAEEPTLIIKEFMKALYSNDKKAFEKTIFPHPESNTLIGKDTLTAKDIEIAKEEIEKLEFQQSQPYTCAGNIIKTNEYPEGTTAIFMTQFRDTNLAIPIEKTLSGWKVDIRFWIAMTKEYKENDPEVLIKKFMYSLIQHNKEELNKICTPNFDFKTIFGKTEAPTEDQYFALAEEMAVVPSRKNECIVLPDKKKLVANENQKDFVWFTGMYGPYKLIFKLVKKEKTWLVEPQDYLSLIGIGIHEQTELSTKPKQ